MISLTKTRKKCCDELSNIENYDKAIADTTQVWECHHRLETHNSDGERRLVQLTAEELDALGMYWKRPASELIFLTKAEHTTLHMTGNKYNKGRKQSKDAVNARAKALKGHVVSSETKRKIAETLKGKSRSDETKRKLSEATKAYWARKKGEQECHQ